MSYASNDQQFDYAEEDSDVIEPVTWPPALCPYCLGKEFYVTRHMAQCTYCQYVIVNRSD